MSSSSLKHEILAQLDGLPFEQQKQVLNFARALMLAKQHGKSGKELFRFAGTIEREDLAVMKQIIEQDCEQINSDEW